MRKPSCLDDMTGDDIRFNSLFPVLGNYGDSVGSLECAPTKRQKEAARLRWEPKGRVNDPMESLD